MNCSLGRCAASDFVASFVASFLVIYSWTIRSEMLAGRQGRLLPLDSRVVSNFCRRSAAYASASRGSAWTNAPENEAATTTTTTTTTTGKVAGVAKTWRGDPSGAESSRRQSWLNVRSSLIASWPARRWLLRYRVRDTFCCCSRRCWCCRCGRRAGVSAAAISVVGVALFATQRDTCHYHRSDRQSNSWQPPCNREYYFLL